jgi:uncharacterized protein YutE (UPF0331/DUF86 family)
MTTNSQAALLKESVEELQQAISHLRYSAQSVKKTPDSLEGVTEAELERVEAFTSRFARVVDLISKKVLRALDEYELYDPGTLLDVANRAEKRGLIMSVDWLRELRDVRNRTAHDYAGERLPEIFRFMRGELGALLSACERMTQYASDRLGSA